MADDAVPLSSFPDWLAQMGRPPVGGPGQGSGLLPLASLNDAALAQQARDAAAQRMIRAAVPGERQEGPITAHLIGQGEKLKSQLSGLGQQLIEDPQGFVAGMVGPGELGGPPLVGALRNVISRGRSGRPIGTPLRMGEGVNNAILERGLQRQGEGPRVVPRDQQEAILRKNWEEHGPERDWDFDKFKTWDREVAQWNKDHPEIPMPTGDAPYTYGNNPDFEKMFIEKHMAGKKALYPGAKAANEYFASDAVELGEDPEGHVRYTAYASPRQIPEELLPPKYQK